MRFCFGRAAEIRQAENIPRLYALKPRKIASREKRIFHAISRE